MGNDDKLRNAAERIAGKIKEGIGKVTDDESLEAEGKAEQTSADLKDSGEKVKDAVKDVTD